MSEKKPNWCDLNAYADGELLPTEAAGVARAVAEDPALADQVATLARLKATVRDRPSLPGSAGPHRRPKTERRSRSAGLGPGSARPPPRPRSSCWPPLC
jgi:anti-sigma factor RsiW